MSHGILGLNMTTDINAATARAEDADVEYAHIAPDDASGGDGKTATDEAKEIGGVLLSALVVVALLRTFIFQPFTIPSESMEPNLYQGDYIVISKFNYGFSRYSTPLTLPFSFGRVFDNAPHRGDIVVFKIPTNNKTDLIKRVIGLPGDRIQMRNDQLYINNVAVPAQSQGLIAAPDAHYINGGDSATLQTESLPGGVAHKMQDMVTDGQVDDTGVYVVPEGHYFMMGDNRDNSEDSRFPKSVGGVDYVPAENLEGKANFILLSWKPGSSLWKPWTWLNLRWNRFFTGLH